jgi:RNA polymerase sigma-70 factor (ECF subfamily)
MMRDGSLIRLDEDIGLMVKVRDGDRSAYEKIYHRYFHLVVSFLARRQGHREACEDLAQEAFARIWRHRGRYQPLAPVKSYLLGVAANVLQESRARARGQHPIGIDDLDALEDTSRPAPLAQAQSAEQLQTVTALMRNLTDRQRQAVELVYLAGLAPKEAARRLGCSRPTLYSHLCSARQKLRLLVRPSQ